MGERLARLRPADLDDAQQRVYDSIVGGPRGEGPQLFELRDAEGRLNGPFGLMLHAPQLGLPLQELGAAIRYRTSMTARCREIAILVVATVMDSAFEWYAHERVGAHVGLTGEELSSLRSLAFTSSDPVETDVFRLCVALMQGRRIEDDTYTALTRVLGQTQILELTVLVGYYSTLAQMLAVFAVGAPGPHEGET